MKLAIFISGRGSNLKALIDAEKNGYFTSEIKLVVANKEALGLNHAKANGISYLISSDDDEIIGALESHDIDLIVLAGYLPLLSEKILAKYTAINIHPSLLPKYGGKGFYGMNVHRAVFNDKEKISGVSVHFVNNRLDEGEIILQKEVDISKCKSPDEISNKVLELEHQSLKEAIKELEVERE